MEKNIPPPKPESTLLVDMLDMAVPLWILRFQEYSFEDRLAAMKELDAGGDLCLRMEYLIHKGPKEGDSAKAFNDTAKVIALLAFQPGGVDMFGRHWESKRKRERI
jgi:hypothetical protein